MITIIIITVVHSHDDHSKLDIKLVTLVTSTKMYFMWNISNNSSCLVVTIRK